jgi:hypothetical protein
MSIFCLAPETLYVMMVMPTLPQSTYIEDYNIGIHESREVKWYRIVKKDHAPWM